MAGLALVTRKDWELSEIQAMCGGKTLPFRRNGQLERELVLTIASSL
jgi:hypothetical protein